MLLINHQCFDQCETSMNLAEMTSLATKNLIVEYLHGPWKGHENLKITSYTEEKRFWTRKNDFSSYTEQNVFLTHNKGRITHQN